MRSRGNEMERVSEGLIGGFPIRISSIILDCMGA